MTNLLCNEIHNSTFLFAQDYYDDKITCKKKKKILGDETCEYYETLKAKMQLSLFRGINLNPENH